METKDLDKKYIVGLGEILFDVLPSGSQLGGAPANFAYHAGQHGLHSVAVSAVGKDALGEAALRLLDIVSRNALLIELHLNSSCRIINLRYHIFQLFLIKKAKSSIAQDILTHSTHSHRM